MSAKKIGVLGCGMIAELRARTIPPQWPVPQTPSRLTSQVHSTWKNQTTFHLLLSRLFLNEQSNKTMMDFFSTEALIALFTLTSLEVVLGIDNVIFIAILAGKLPESQRDYARKMGLTLAVVSRAILVLAIGFVMQLNQPLFAVFGTGFSGKDIILVLGGLFLLGKATYEIHRKIEHASDPESAALGVTTLKAVLLQVLSEGLCLLRDGILSGRRNAADEGRKAGCTRSDEGVVTLVCSREEKHPVGGATGVQYTRQRVERITQCLNDADELPHGSIAGFLFLRITGCLNVGATA